MNNNRHVKSRWAKALVEEELKFWYTWFKTKGYHWPQDYKNRMNPDTEIQDYVQSFLADGTERILDVGSGPLTVLGKKMNGKKLGIVACDALGKQYQSLCKEFGIKPLVKTYGCETEELTRAFKEDEFDLVHAQNCVDHGYDPLQAICEMLTVVNPGGYVLLFHEVNEADNEKYSGLHQWNFYASDGDFIVDGKAIGINVNRELEEFADIASVVKNGYIFNIIRKKKTPDYKKIKKAKIKTGAKTIIRKLNAKKK